MSALLAKARNNRESGFTLIELLTVIVIIGILAAIAIPVFTSQRQRAQDAASVSEARSVLTAMESYSAGQAGGVLVDADSATAGVQVPVNFSALLVQEGATSKTGDSLNTTVTLGNGTYTVVTTNTAGKASNTATTGYTEAKNPARFSQSGSIADFSAATTASEAAASAAGVITFS